MTWQKLVEREGDFFKNVLLYQALEEEFPKVFGRHHPSWLTIRKGNTFSHHQKPEQNHTFAQFLETEQKKNSDFLTGLISKGKGHFLELLEFCKNIPSLDVSSHAQLANLLQQYCHHYKQPYPYFTISPMVELFQNKEHIPKIAEWRLFARDHFNKAHRLAEPLFQEIAKKLHLSVQELKYLTPAEIVDALSLHDKIQCRLECYFLFENGKYELKENASFVFDEDHSKQKVKELRGQGTFSASVKGKVRIIRT
ncbi:hypothetical protein HYX12_04215, partial [Candidatus Woesearchaeota archaeon]|nr:hypothetical protein [Candidatus Woesearchaeota archaeon]